MKSRVLFFICLFSTTAFAKSPRVAEIVIRGNKIIESSAIRSKILSKVGNRYSLKKVRKDVRQIFNTGWFYEIEVQKKKRADKKLSLIYRVKEKPIVGKIIYKGNKELSKKELGELVTFPPYDFLSYKKIQKALKDIRAEYKKEGYYLAEISHSIKKTSDPKKVHLVIHIKENKKVKVKKIQFLGNKNISSKEIKSFMRTREINLFSLIFSSQSFNQDILKQDLNNIRFIYMDRGYWQIFVAPPEIIISPDKSELTISIPVQEGEQYKVGNISFAGDLILGVNSLKQDMETEETEIFSYGNLQRDIKRIETFYGDKGYGFVNVIPKFFSLPTDRKNTINVLFEIQKGKKVRIRKISITGNSYTRDKVIRREVRIFESELYNETDKNRSIQNIRRLGFFEDVKFISKTIKNRDDLVDMEVVVKERENTGTIELGLGYDGYFGISFNGKFQKYNLFGRGYNVSTDANFNFTRQYMNLNFSDPYFLDSEWYLGGSFYLDRWTGGDRSRDLFVNCDEFDKKTREHQQQIAEGKLNTPKELAVAERSLEISREICLNTFPSVSHRGYTEKKISGGFTLGRSITDTLRLLFSYRLENVQLTNTIDDELYPSESASGARNPMEMIVEYDSRSDRLYPKGGIYTKNSLTYDGFIGRFNYFTLSTNFRFYHSLIWDLVLRTNIQYSQHIQLDDEGTVPFDRLFLLGGINSLRGFRYFSVGPRKQSRVIYEKAIKYGHPAPKKIASRVFGGMRQLYTNLEMEFPIFPEAQLRGVIFMDLGSAYDQFEETNIRVNWGFGLRVLSPLGPIRLEMGFPFNPRSDYRESSSEFQFAMGLPF